MSDELLRLLNANTFGDDVAEDRLCVLLMRRTKRTTDSYDRVLDVDPFLGDDHPVITDDIVEQWLAWVNDNRSASAAVLLLRHSVRIPEGVRKLAHDALTAQKGMMEKVEHGFKQSDRQRRSAAFLASLRWHMVPRGSAWHIVDQPDLMGGPPALVCNQREIPASYEYALGVRPDDACSACIRSRLWVDGVRGWVLPIEYNDCAVLAQTFATVVDE